MDDYNISSLQESNNEWVSRLVSILIPNIITGIKTLYDEAYKICIESDEPEKYLMTFQNLLSRVPKWNNDIIGKEVNRIKEESGCDYLEDLITCVHIINLKALTCVRVGMKHKTIDINIPKLDTFIHEIYILLARKIYTNVYLFEEHIPPLQVQRNSRELELICKECISEAIRGSIPIDSILRSYLDETIEENVETTMTSKIEVTNPETSEDSLNSSVVASAVSPTPDVVVASAVSPTPVVAAASAVSPTPYVNESTSETVMDTPTSNASNPEVKSLTFSNIDEAQNTDKSIVNVHAPKDITTLENISELNHQKRLLEEEIDENDDDEEKLKIMDDTNITLDIQTL